jgi:hypothetical protein
MSLYSSANPPADQPPYAPQASGPDLGTFFRFALIYLGLAPLVSWIVNAVWYFTKWSALTASPRFNGQEFLLRMALGLVSSLVFAGVLWMASKGRSEPLLFVGLGYAVLGALALLMLRVVLTRPPFGTTNTLYSAFEWLNSAVFGRGHPLSWLINLNLRFSPMGFGRINRVLPVLDWVQQAFAIGFFSFALVKQPKQEA